MKITKLVFLISFFCFTDLKPAEEAQPDLVLDTTGLASDMLYVLKKSFVSDNLLDTPELIAAVQVEPQKISFEDYKSKIPSELLTESKDAFIRKFQISFTGSGIHSYVIIDDCLIPKCLFNVPVNYTVSAAIISRDNKVAIPSLVNGMIPIIDIKSQRIICVLNNKKRIFSAAISNDYRILVVYERDTNSVKIIDLATDITLFTLNDTGHCQVIISNDNKSVITSNRSLIDFTTPNYIKTLSVLQLNLIYWLYETNFAGSPIVFSEKQLALFKSLPVNVQVNLKRTYNFEV